MKHIDLAKHKVLLACAQAFFFAFNETHRPRQTQGPLSLRQSFCFLLSMKHIDLAKHLVLLPCAKAFFFAFNETHRPRQTSFFFCF